MTKEEQIDKLIDDIEKEFEKVNIPVMEKLTLFSKVQNAIYKWSDLVQNSKSGRWSKTIDEDGTMYWLCSKCRCGSDKATNYCPECGSDNREG